MKTKRDGNIYNLKAIANGTSCRVDWLDKMILYYFNGITILCIMFKRITKLTHLSI